MTRSDRIDLEPIDPVVNLHYIFTTAGSVNNQLVDSIRNLLWIVFILHDYSAITDRFWRSPIGRANNGCSGGL